MKNYDHWKSCVKIPKYFVQFWCEILVPFHYKFYFKLKRLLFHEEISTQNGNYLSLPRKSTMHFCGNFDNDHGVTKQPNLGNNELISLCTRAKMIVCTFLV